MDLETFLRRWWVAKYKLPWTHECAQDSTLEDLLVEFYEDHFDKHPEDARKALAAGGEFKFEDSGDPLIDKWEEELAAGITPDLEEGLSVEARQKLIKERERYKQARGAARQFGSTVVNDDYQSKFAALGSKEEAALMKGKLMGQDGGDAIEDIYNKLMR